jgi:hypothetical protein
MRPKKKRKDEERNKGIVNAIIQAEAIRKRVNAVLLRCGYVWHRGIWRRFDAVMAHQIPIASEREKVLKRLLSKYGSAILASDSRYMDMLEKAMNIKNKGNAQRSN